MIPAAQGFRTIERATVVSNQRVGDKIFITRFLSPEVSSSVNPGQFVMVSFPDCLDPLLARAFSVSDAHEKILSLLYASVGKGTTRLSKLEKGDVVVINGPLGTGFPELSKGEKVWVVVGGSGAALVPILYRDARRSKAEIKIFYGARTRRQLVNFKGIEVNFATDDGSRGYHGTVIKLVDKHLAKEKPDKIFGCGPTPMLVKLQEKANGGFEVFISVETPMACGMGFCQGCPVKIKDAPDYFLACKNGPVFEAKEIELE